LEQRGFLVIARVTTESVYIGARGDRLNGLEGGRDRENWSFEFGGFAVQMTEEM
jgi:hypothetical protein